MEAQSVENHVHWASLTYGTVDCNGSGYVAIELNRRCGALVHPLDAVDEEIADSVSLEDLKWVFMGDPIKYVFKVYE